MKEITKFLEENPTDTTVTKKAHTNSTVRTEIILEALNQLKHKPTFPKKLKNHYEALRYYWLKMEASPNRNSEIKRTLNQYNQKHDNELSTIITLIKENNSINKTIKGKY